MIDVRLSKMERSDLRGIPFRVGERVEWAVPALLPDVDHQGPMTPGGLGNHLRLAHAGWAPQHDRGMVAVANA
ncbi:hypothetical protein CCP4SC76_6770002 [Gammaproteobacteria bacterium]